MTPQNWLAMLPSWVSQAPRPKVELKKLVVSCPTALIAEPTLVAILATLLKTVPMTWVIHVVKPRKALVMAVPMAPSPTKPPNALSPTTMADHTKLKKVKILARMNTPPLISQRITGPKNPPVSRRGPVVDGVNRKTVILAVGVLIPVSKRKSV